MRNCIDCKKPLINFRALRCKSCANRGINNPNYKHGFNLSDKTCIDCSCKLSTMKAKRCRKCASKINETKFKDGQNHWNYKNGKSKSKEYKKIYSKQYRNSTPQRKLRARIGSRLREILKRRNIIKTTYLSKMLPYSISELKISLESKFKPGMTWKNIHLWHIDHKIPDSHFKYTATTDTQFLKSWSITNLQPLWAKENLIKHNKLI